MAEAATGGVLWEKVFLEIFQNSQENTCARASFLFTCEFCEISKNTFFTEHLWATASMIKDNNINLNSQTKFFSSRTSTQIGYIYP